MRIRRTLVVFCLALTLTILLVAVCGCGSPDMTEKELTSANAIAAGVPIVTGLVDSHEKQVAAGNVDWDAMVKLQKESRRYAKQLDDLNEQFPPPAYGQTADVEAAWKKVQPHLNRLYKAMTDMIDNDTSADESGVSDAFATLRADLSAVRSELEKLGIKTP